MDHGAEERSDLMSKSGKPTQQDLASLQAELERHLRPLRRPVGFVFPGHVGSQLAARLLNELAQDCAQLRELLQEDHPTQHYGAFAALSLVEHRAKRLVKSVWELDLLEERPPSQLQIEEAREEERPAPQLQSSEVELARRLGGAPLGSPAPTHKREHVKKASPIEHLQRLVPRKLSPERQLELYPESGTSQRKEDEEPA